MTTALMALLCAANPGGLHLDPSARQTVSFTVQHPLKDVSGKTHELEGAARLLPDGAIQVEVRASVSSLRTGNVELDDELALLLEAGRFPYVTVRALVPPPAGRRLCGTTVDVAARVRIDLHGKRQTFPAKVRVAYGATGQATVAGQFVIELPDFGIEAPTYMFRSAATTLPVAFELAWTADQTTPEKMANL